MKSREFEHNFEQTSFRSSLNSVSTGGRRQLFVVRQPSKEKSTATKVAVTASARQFPLPIQERDGKLEQERTEERPASQVKDRKEVEFEERIERSEQEAEDEEEEEEEEEAKEETEEMEEATEEFMEREREEAETKEEETEEPTRRKESGDKEDSQEIDGEEEIEVHQAEKLPSSFFYVATQLLQTSRLGNNQISLQTQALEPNGATIEEIEDSEVSEPETTEELAVTYNQNSEEDEEVAFQKKPIKIENKGKRQEKEAKEDVPRKDDQYESAKEETFEIKKKVSKEGGELEEENKNKNKNRNKKREDETQEITKEKSTEREDAINQKHLASTSSSILENKKDGGSQTTENQKKVSNEFNAHLDFGTTSPLLFSSLLLTTKGDENGSVSVQKNVQEKEEKREIKKNEINSRRGSLASEPLVVKEKSLEKEKKETSERAGEKTLESTVSLEPRSEFLVSYLSCLPSTSSSSTSSSSTSSFSSSASFSASFSTSTSTSSASTSSSSSSFLSSLSASSLSSFSSQTQQKEKAVGVFSKFQTQKTPQTNSKSLILGPILNDPPHTIHQEKTTKAIRAYVSSPNLTDSKEPVQNRLTTDKSSRYIPSPFRDKEKVFSKSQISSSLARLPPFPVSISTDDPYSESDSRRRFHGIPKHNKQKKTRWKDVQESTKLPPKYMRLKNDTSPLYTELFSQWKEIENMYISASALFVAAAKKEIHASIYDVEQERRPYLTNGLALSLQVKRKNASFLALKTLLDKFEEERNSRLKSLGSEFVLDEFYSERVLKPMGEKTNSAMEASSHQTEEENHSATAKPNSSRSRHFQFFSHSVSAPSSVANHKLVLLLQQEPIFFQSMDEAILMLQKRKDEQKEKEKEKKKLEPRTKENKAQEGTGDLLRWDLGLPRHQSREKCIQAEEFSFNCHLHICLSELRKLYKMLDARFYQDACLVAYLLDLHHEGLTHQFRTKIAAIKERSEELTKNFVDQKSKLLLHYEETSQVWNRKAKKFQTQLLQWLNLFNNHQSSVMNLLHLLLFQNSKNKKKWNYKSQNMQKSGQKSSQREQKPKGIEIRTENEIKSKEKTEKNGHFSAALDLASFLEKKKSNQKHNSKLQTEVQNAPSVLPRRTDGKQHTPGEQRPREVKKDNFSTKIKDNDWKLRYQELERLALLIHKYSTELHKVTILASVDEIKATQATQTTASMSSESCPSLLSSGCASGRLSFVGSDSGSGSGFGSGSSSDSASASGSSSGFVVDLGSGSSFSSNTASGSHSFSCSNSHFPFSTPTLHSTPNHFQMRRIEQEIKKRRSLNDRLPGLFQLGTPIKSSLCFQVKAIYQRWVSFLNRKECKSLLQTQKKHIQAVCARYLKEFNSNKKELKRLQHNRELLANERRLLFETSQETGIVSLDCMKTIESLQKMLSKLEPEIERVSRLQTDVHKAYVAAQRKENLILKDPPEERTINKICDMYSVLLLEKIKFSQEFHDQLRTIHLTYKNQQEFFQSAQFLEFETEIKNLFLIRRTREWDTWKIFEDLLLNNEEKIKAIQKHFQSVITSESKSDQWLGRELIHRIRGMNSKWEDYLERYTLTRLNFNLVHLEILAHILEKTN